MGDPGKGDPVTPCMDVYRAKIQYGINIDKLKLSIVVSEDLKNREMIGDTWYPKSSMSNLRCFVSYDSKHKARVH